MWYKLKVINIALKIGAHIICMRWINFPSYGINQVQKVSTMNFWQGVLVLGMLHPHVQYEMPQSYPCCNVVNPSFHIFDPWWPCLSPYIRHLFFSKWHIHMPNMKSLNVTLLKILYSMWLETHPLADVNMTSWKPQIVYATNLVSLSHPIFRYGM